MKNSTKRFSALQKIQSFHKSKSRRQRALAVLLEIAENSKASHPDRTAAAAIVLAHAEKTY